MLRLLFPISDIERLAEHAIAAPGCKASFRDIFDGTTPVPALWLVGDEGIYLMSNGLPHLPHPTNTGRSLVAYADGFHTCEDRHTVDDVIGGDDFCQVLPLLAPQSDGHVLHTEITRGVAAGATYFAIDMDTDTFAYHIMGPASRKEDR